MAVEAVAGSAAEAVAAAPLLASATRSSCDPLKTSWSPGNSTGWLVHCQNVYVLQPAGSGPTLSLQRAIHSGLAPKPG